MSALGNGRSRPGTSFSGENQTHVVIPPFGTATEQRNQLTGLLVRRDGKRCASRFWMIGMVLQPGFGVFDKRTLE